MAVVQHVTSCPWGKWWWGVVVRQEQGWRRGQRDVGGTLGPLPVSAHLLVAVAGLFPAATLLPRFNQFGQCLGPGPLAPPGGHTQPLCWDSSHCLLLDSYHCKSLYFISQYFKFLPSLLVLCNLQKCCAIRGL